MPQAEQTLATRAYKLTNYGVEFSRPLTADEFEELGYVLTRITNSLPWLWGDWLLAGEAAWDDEARYRLASSISGQPRARLAAFLRVAVSYRHADRLYAPWPYYCAALRSRRVTDSPRCGWCRSTTGRSTSSWRSCGVGGASGGRRGARRRDGDRADGGRVPSVRDAVRRAGRGSGADRCGRRSHVDRFTPDVGEGAHRARSGPAVAVGVGERLEDVQQPRPPSFRRGVIRFADGVGGPLAMRQLDRLAPRGRGRRAERLWHRAPRLSGWWRRSAVELLVQRVTLADGIAVCGRAPRLCRRWIVANAALAISDRRHAARAAGTAPPSPSAGGSRAAPATPVSRRSGRPCA